MVAFNLQNLFYVIVLSTQAAEYFCHLNSNFAFTYTTSQSLAYAYLASPNGAFSEDCERRSRSFNPRNPLLYGFGDGDVLLADILAGARSSEPEFTVELDPEIVNGEVYKFKITNKLMGLNQEIVVSALRGGVVLESRIYDDDHMLVREKITEADSFRNAANELWFPIRWVETSYENHAGSPPTIAVKSENIVEHFTPSAIGNNEALELVGLFDGAIPVVLEQPDGKVLTTHLSNGVFDDVRLNEQLAITEKTTKETGS